MVKYENLEVEVSDEIGTITISRPKALNALNPATIHELADAVASLRGAVRALILTGAGEKAFVAGADIKAMAGLTATEAYEFAKAGHRAFRSLEVFPVPVLAAVNGYALGGGCELVLACDFAVASESARFGQPEVALGIVPGFGGTARLVRRVGPGWARRLITTGEQIKADVAERIGLVTEVVSADQLLPRTRELAASIVKQAPLAVAWSKEAIQVAEETDLGTALAYEPRVFANCFPTEDRKEGMNAFVEKRPPNWTGK